MIACKPRIATLIVLCVVLIARSSAAQPAERTQAEQLLLRGNYAESEAAYDALLDDLPVQATLGLSRCHWQRGRRAEAVAALDRQLSLADSSASLHARRAWCAMQSGEWKLASAHVQKALALDARNVHASWIQAELFRMTGEVENACRAYETLARRYDSEGRKSESPSELYWYAKALAQHARFNDDQQRFRQLTSQLYPRILSLEPNFWPAHYETGQLLLEKFNASDAESAFNDALRINPQAADVHAGLARLALHSFQLDRVRRRVARALQTNPKHLDSLICRADMFFASLEPVAASTALNQALKLNPQHTPTLGRLAAATSLSTSPQLEENERHIPGSEGEFYAAQAAALEQARRYPQAGASLRRAIAAMPQLVGLRGQLGMIEMRLGHETEARELLEESFSRDPYNVRVKNQLEVLDLLESYATLESEHFILRYDREHDAALAQHMADYAEECYEELTTTFEFQLPEKALIEVFCEGQGVPARQWFGARMVGLPNIHTIAACGGNIVAMVSPSSERRRLNWADILRHEIVHLINLQQTDYAVPHWLTEGCAVWQENRPRRPRWDQLLAKRGPRGELFNLDTINLGFLKPRSADEWHLAYCQAEQYIDLIAREHGVEGVRKLLNAYRDNLSPEAAISHSLGITQASLETRYAEELVQILAQLSERSDLKPQPKLAELKQLWEQNPNNAEIGAKLALARLRRGDYPGAGRLAQQVLEADSNQPIARLVKAKLLTRIGDERAATVELQRAVEADSPPAEAVKLLAGIHLRQGRLDEARRLYQRGAEASPTDTTVDEGIGRRCDSKTRHRRTEPAASPYC